jgi:thiol-disulfide isomerase/thioredoxin
VILVAARLLLGLVFALAGLAKLADRNGTREAVLAFGSPARIAGVLAIALPAAELAVAILLLPARTAVYGAIGAVALLVLFTAALANALARGRSPDCHCFGQLHSTPTSWRTLARSGALLAAALVVLVAGIVEPPPSAIAWIGDLEGAELLALVVALACSIVLAVGAVAFVSLMRSYGQVLTRLERVEGALARVGLSFGGELEMPELGLTPGSPVPAFTARMANGEEVAETTLFAKTSPTLLLFTSPGCGQCTALMPTVARWQRDHAERLSIVVASAGALEDIRAEAEELGLDNVLHDQGSRLSELFGASGTPSAVLVTPDGTIASWVAAGREWIEQLVEQSGGATVDEGLALGADAPAIELPSLTGERVSLASLRGRDALLVFWNPGCGYCRELHPDLLAREAANGEGPRLVVVSSGDEESTRAEGFTSLVLLDGDYRAAAAFGAHGTPMGVLLDADGRVASNVAAGADAVLELADGRVTKRRG